VWRHARLVVEVDGHATHGTRFAFEDDRRRDLALVRAGWRVVRFTHAQIAFDAPEVAAALRDQAVTASSASAGRVNSRPWSLATGSYVTLPPATLRPSMKPGSEPSARCTPWSASLRM
jgi:hypothetical protein